MPEELQETLSEYDSLVAEIERAKTAGEAPALPEGIVLDAEFPGGFYKKRPCLEEYVAARYPADTYDSFFSSATETEDGTPRIPWGPGWSNPGWVDPVVLEELPKVLHVRSQVRRQATRTQRATAPKRHRFKQYLFGDPSHRLIRNRNLAVQTSRVLAGIDELIEKEQLGLLTVHLPNGARLDLLALKAAEFKVHALPLPAPQPNPPLDSIANDEPAGNPMPQYIEGSFPGDPAADRALDNMLKDKKSEQRDTEDEDPINGEDPLAEGADDGEDDVPPPDGPATETPGELVGELLEDDPLAEAPLTEDKTEDSVSGTPASVGAQVPETAETTEPPVVDTVPEAPAPTATQHASKGKKGHKR